MEKTAQERRLRDRLRETISPGGIIEETFNPEFKKIMDKLRKVDDQVRAQLTGKTIGDEEPKSDKGEILDDPKSVKEFLKAANKHLNSLEYMKVVADIGMFHQRVGSAVALLSGFEYDMDAVHNKFLFSDLTPDRETYDKEYAEYLEDLKSRFSRDTEASQKYNLVVEASIIDFLSNIGSQRGRALMAWERRYPKRVKILKNETKILISRSSSLFDNISKLLKIMATARASRKVDDYVSKAERIVELFKPYDKLFRDYYDKNVRNFLEKQTLLAPIEDASKEEMFSKEISKEEDIPSPQMGLPFGSGGISGGQPTILDELGPITQRTPTAPTMPTAPTASTVPTVSTVPVVPVVPVAPIVPSAEPSPVLPAMPKGSWNPAIKPTVPMSQQEYVGRKPPSSSPSILEDPELRALMGEPIIERMQVKRLHKPITLASGGFIESLESLSGESPLVLAKFITKYAKSIEMTDPVTYYKLMDIVDSIEV